MVHLGKPTMWNGLVTGWKGESVPREKVGDGTQGRKSKMTEGCGSAEAVYDKEMEC